MEIVLNMKNKKMKSLQGYIEWTCYEILMDLKLIKLLLYDKNLIQH